MSHLIKIYDDYKLLNLDNKLLSIQEVAEELRSQRKLVLDLMNKDLLPYIKKGSQRFVNKADVQILLIKLSAEDYPNNFLNKKNVITQYFPVKKIEEIN